MKIYKGFWRDSACVVTVDDQLLDPQHKVRNHSPDGFQWGYAGSGPAQLSLALCINAVGVPRGERIYQYFKCSVVAPLPRGKDWVFTEQQIIQAIEYLEGQLP